VFHGEQPFSPSASRSYSLIHRDSPQGDDGKCFSTRREARSNNMLSSAEKILHGSSVE
jgi:hypothetical protein